MIPKKITPAFLVELARRRWFALVGPLVLALVAAGALLLVLPCLYKSEATILVQGQGLPSAFVQPTVAAYDVEDRLQATIQQVMSRPRLQEIATRFALYPDLEGRPAEDKLTRMREQIGIELGDQDELSAGKAPGHKDVAYFRLSFAHTDPETARRVAGRLSSLFVEENVRSRAQQARLAADFLGREVRQLRAALEAQEGRLAAYKQAHMGELPEELQPNLNALGRLQTELGTNQTALSAAEERALLLQRALADFNQAQLAKNPGSVIPPPSLFAGSPEARLTALRQSLPSLEARYMPSHPNVIKTRNEIARLEAELGRRAGSTGGAGPLAADLDRGDLNAQLLSLKNDIGRLEHKRQDILRQVTYYQQRVEATPQREQELAALNRDYELAQANYESLLKKRVEAKMAENLEGEQQGAQFRVIDPPNLPERPFAPNKRRLLALALFVGLGLGVSLAFVLESADGSLRRVEDVEECVRLNVLATIPLVKTEAEPGRKRRRWLAAAGALAILVGAGLVIYSHYAAPL